MMSVSPVVELVVDTQSMRCVKFGSQADVQKKFQELTKDYDRVLACDGSYKDGVGSVGITDGREHWHFRLDNYMGNILTELISILHALRLAISEFPHPRKLLIAIDCESILKVLRTVRRDNRVSQVSAAINYGLSSFWEPCQVTLLWVPGHRGVTLNEIADTNARVGRELPDDGTPLLPMALRTRDTRWRRRETCDLLDCSPDSQLAKHRDTDQILVEMMQKQSFLNADMHEVPDYPEFTWCELCYEQELGPGVPQTPAHIFLECSALVDARQQLRTEFLRFGLPFRLETILDGYCIDATAKFLGHVKYRKTIFTD